VTSGRIHELLSDSGLRWSGSFSGLVLKLDVLAPAWALLDLQSMAVRNLGSLDTDAGAVYAKPSLADGMRFEFRVRMPSPAAAEKAAASQEQRARALESFSISALQRRLRELGFVWTRPTLADGCATYRRRTFDQSIRLASVGG
jgi:hypothetical protein